MSHPIKTLPVRSLIRLAAVVAPAILITITSLIAQQEQLKIDPMLLVSVAECRNISRTLERQFWPGWSFEKTPILLYRPGVQDVLINYPHLPKGFREYNGFSPLGKEKIYVRDNETLFTDDDQNTSADIENVRVLVVADTFSRERNNLRGEMGRDRTHQQNWLREWNFIQTPYDDIRLMLHEGFHVYQHAKAPGKFADETRIADYPVLDVTNNTLYALEAAILRDALLASDVAERNKRIRQYIAVRHERVSRFSPELVEYENLNEFNEGLAKYIEYRWLQSGGRVQPLAEIWYRNGFEGYRGILDKKYSESVKNMKTVIAVDDDRWGENRFGAGPLRFKLYDVGAAEALLLDGVSPEWKNEIFGKHVYLGDLLERAVPMSESDRAEYLRLAKADYAYDDLYRQKAAFEKEGYARVQEKLNSIRNTDGTLVHIFYSDIADTIRIGFTPFGVTRIRPSAAIYDLVPIAVKIDDRTILRMKTINPVIIDQGEKSITFAVPENLDIQTTPTLKLDTKEFTFSAGAAEVRHIGKELRIFLRKTGP